MQYHNNTVYVWVQYTGRVTYFFVPSSPPNQICFVAYVEGVENSWMVLGATNHDFDLINSWPGLQYWNGMFFVVTTVSGMVWWW